VRIIREVRVEMSSSKERENQKMAEQAEKLIRIIAFNGKATNWPIW